MDIVTTPYPHRAKDHPPVVDANGMQQAEYLTSHPLNPGRGYHVQIGTVASLFFASTVYGSDENAFVSAILYRDKILSILESVSPSDFGLGIKKLGYMGVTYNSVQNAYAARWTVAEPESRKKVKSKSFSVSKYSLDGALQKAIEARIEAVGGYPASIIEQINLVTQRVIKARKPVIHSKLLSSTRRSLVPGV